MIIYGLIAYIGMILLTIGYFLAKKAGDSISASSASNQGDKNYGGLNEEV